MVCRDGRGKKGGGVKKAESRRMNSELLLAGSFVITR